MSFIRTHQRKIIGLGVVGGKFIPMFPLSHRPFSAAEQVLADTKSPCVGAFYFFNPLRTPGVSNIEKRWSSGGATPDHTPAVASPRGQPDQTIGKHEGQHGYNTAHHEEKIGEQRPQVSPNPVLQ